MAVSELPAKRRGLSAKEAAIATLVVLGFLFVELVSLVARAFPEGLAVPVLLLGASVAGWEGIRRREAARRALLATAFGLVAASFAFVMAWGYFGDLVTLALIGGAALWLSRQAFAVRVRLPRAEPPRRPVMVWNPRSGGGKALAADLAEEARRRGIEPIELQPGQDLEQLVRQAVADGADGLAAAGGDGTQALVARIAAEADLPYACIPAGTRNHFALDLGVDREDLIGALDAFVNGGEKRVDLAEVNGRTFVNNVSLGLYAVAVQKKGYRDSKLRTMLDTAPEVLGVSPTADQRLVWRSPEGNRHNSAVVILVSNNAYRLGRMLGSGTRPRIDDGELGIAVLSGLRHRHGGRPHLHLPWRVWETESFTVDSDGPVPAGVDGEALVLQPPLEFSIRPRVLRVRIAAQHPGASPSAGQPTGVIDGLKSLVALASEPTAR